MIASTLGLILQVHLADLELTRACEARSSALVTLLPCTAVRNHGTGATLLVTRCAFTHNEYYHGAAIRAEASTLLRAIATNFTSNRVDSGVLFLVGGNKICSHEAPWSETRASPAASC